MNRRLLALMTVAAVLLSALPQTDVARVASSQQASAPTCAVGGQEQAPSPRNNNTNPCPNECMCLCCPGHGTEPTPCVSTIDLATAVVTARFTPNSDPFLFATLQPIFRPPRDSLKSQAIPIRAGLWAGVMSGSDVPPVGLAYCHGMDERDGQHTTTYVSDSGCDCDPFGFLVLCNTGARPRPPRIHPRA